MGKMENLFLGNISPGGDGVSIAVHPNNERYLP